MEEQNLNQEHTENPRQDHPPAEEIPDKIIIRMWPKTPIVYPLALMALICWFVGMFFGTAPQINKMKNMVAAETVQEAAANENQDASTPESESSTAGNENQQNETTNPETQTEGSTPTAQTSVSQDYETVVKNFVGARTVDKFFGVIFLIIFAFCLFTLCIDIEVRWALISFSLVVIALLVIYITNEKFDYLPSFFTRITALSPTASPTFYFLIALIWVILMILSAISVRFHYVIVESNEVTVIGGLLERQQRFPTARMKYSKDIQDVFEYYLPFIRSGRLIFYFPEQNETVVIDNVIQIDKVIGHLNHISGMIQVSGYDR